MEIAFILAAGLVLAYLARGQGSVRPPEPLIPLIDHVVYAGDPRTDKLVRLDQQPGEKPYRILDGQFLRLHWQILHADQIRISGIGEVQAIGSQDIYPETDTRIRIEAGNPLRQSQETIRVSRLGIPKPGIRLIPFSELPDTLPFPHLEIPGPGPIPEYPKINKEFK